MSAQHRFFVPPGAIQDGRVRFSREQAHQMASVLRLHTGATVTALDNSGWQYTVKLQQLSGAMAIGEVSTRGMVRSEPRTKISLYVGLIRGPRMEIVLQKCTELGVVSFVPVVTHRSVVGGADEMSESKLERWQRIIVEAAEQSGRGKLPTLQPALPFAEACEQVRGRTLLLWERERETSLRDALAVGDARAFSVNLFVGPEGGFTDAEVERARSLGLQPVSLGARVLRAETASIAATTAVLFAQSDLG